MHQPLSMMDLFGLPPVLRSRPAALAAGPLTALATAPLAALDWELRPGQPMSAAAPVYTLEPGCTSAMAYTSAAVCRSDRWSASLSPLALQ